MLPTIDFGNKNDYVKVAKYLLGYSKAGKATNHYDSAFLSFVKKWQINHNLNGSGKIGPQSWGLIAEQSKIVTSADKQEIYALQILFDRVGVNGKLNTITKNAIKEFQKAAGIKEDGICGKETWKALIASPNIAHKHTINFKQNDVRWGNLSYSKTNSKTQTYSNSACAPTSAASVVYSLKNKNVLPTTLGSQAIQWGYRRASGGTDGKFFSKVASFYGFSRMVETKSKTIFKHCLDSGGYVICAFKAGSWWTKTGHYSPAWSYDDTYYYVDNTISTIKIKRKLSYLSSDCRAFYCFYP